MFGIKGDAGNAAAKLFKDTSNNLKLVIIACHLQVKVTANTAVSAGDWKKIKEPHSRNSSISL